VYLATRVDIDFPRSVSVSRKKLCPLESMPTRVSARGSRSYDEKLENVSPVLCIMPQRCVATSFMPACSFSTLLPLLLPALLRTLLPQSCSSRRSSCPPAVFRFLASPPCQCLFKDVNKCPHRGRRHFLCTFFVNSLFFKTLSFASSSALSGRLDEWW
jgi:hypothetical protein